MSIAEALGTDIQTVIYGLPDGTERERKLRRLAVMAGCTLALAVVCGSLMRVAVGMKTNVYDIRLYYFVKVLCLPLLCALVGWTLMEAAVIFAGFKPLRGKATRIVGIVVAVSAVLYLLMALPPLLALLLPSMPDWVQKGYNLLMRPLMGMRGLLSHHIWMLPMGGLLRMTVPEQERRIIH